MINRELENTNGLLAINYTTLLRNIRRIQHKFGIEEGYHINIKHAILFLRQIYDIKFIGDKNLNSVFINKNPKHTSEQYKWLNSIRRNATVFECIRNSTNKPNESCKAWLDSVMPSCKEKRLTLVCFDNELPLKQWAEEGWKIVVWHFTKHAHRFESIPNVTIKSLDCCFSAFGVSIYEMLQYNVIYPHPNPKLTHTELCNAIQQNMIETDVPFVYKILWTEYNLKIYFDNQNTSEKIKDHLSKKLNI